MNIVKLPYFGQIDFAQLNDYYATTTEFNGTTIRFALFFANKSINEEQIINIKTFFDTISGYDIQNKKEIHKDFNHGGEVIDYINFYLDELYEEELREIIDYDNEDKSKEEQLLSKLKLISVGLYPDEKFGADNYASFDYSIEIGGEPCNQVLAVRIDNKGKITCISWES